VPRAQLRPILEPGHPEIEVAALERLLDRRPLHLDELRLAAKPVSDHPRDLDVEPAHRRRIGRIGFDERRAALGVAAPAQRQTVVRLGERITCQRSSQKSAQYE